VHDHQQRMPRHASAVMFQWLKPIFGDRFSLMLEGPAHTSDRLVLQRPHSIQLRV
jgi:cytochrome P450